MSHALLLRLFLAPSFFSVHVALQYLKTYPDNIGITHYLTSRLREFDLKELEDVWGFICHLLVTRPSKSTALEVFVVEKAEQSTHIAILTLWFMQATLNDLSQAQSRRGTTKSESFAICQRVIHKCHDIVYGDPPEPTGGPYSGLPVHPRSRFGHKRIKPHAIPALVGMGTMLAGAPGMPALTPVSGQIAIEQGRREEPHQLSGVVRDLQEGEARVSTSSHTGSIVNDDDDTGYDSPGSGPSIPAPKHKPSNLSIFTQSASSIQTVTAQAARTSPSLTTRPPRMSDDPFGQLDPPTPPSKQSTLPPVHSTPSIGLRPGLNRASSLNHYAHQESMLNQYDPFTQSQLLRGHYCRGEVQFLLTLESISNRLLVVPKLARVSALRAELTNLNNKLPAEICVPMWCPSSDKCSTNSFVTQPHHRIVRIPPGESVVLNSAERAPYVLIMEFLNNDLDFDPSKRMNKEILKKLVTQKPNSRGSFPQTPVTTNPSRDTFTAERPRSWTESSIGNSQEEPEPIVDPPSAIEVTPSTPLDPPEDDDEEIDLVEQLYGAKLRDEPVDLTDTIVLPAPPKNKVLDMNRWQMGSAPSTPGIGGLPSSLPRTPSMTASGFSSRDESPTNGQVAVSDALSMEDYSERMRTAAVMLAQLNSNLVREPVTAVAPGSTPTAAPSPGPGGSNDAASAMRMRLQPAEAAAIRERIMAEMISLEDQRMARMMEHGEGEGIKGISDPGRASNTKEDEAIVRRELNRADPSAAVFRESWAGKKARIRTGSPYGHLVNWDCISVIVKTGGDLRQEQLATLLIKEFENIWKEENCQCWVRYFRILITGSNSGLVETITDAVSIHSIKKAEYARRIAEGNFGHVTLLDHFINTYGDPSSVKFARAQKNFAKSLAGCSIITFLLQIKDRHNGNILLDRDGHLVHIDFGFMLGNSPGGVGFESAPFKLPLEYVDILGGVDAEPFLEFKKLFHEGFLAARKHSDRIITLVDLMQKDSAFPCFATFGEQTSQLLKERFQPSLTTSAITEYIDSLIVTSLGSAWTRLYDSFQYYSQSIL
ncbi:phosphatidylinositol 4-kinase [Rhizoctonia solani AG-1 IB]|uniref:1-phosphatidylinositol 4-kinase n=1 Tax=Thanatephorus cucumeris (strain AG1-IB / isolate 7/3/14) TaxID=1108050 RepID=A0A0B7F5Z3_THACB|nr:phosphatidylinositol 4-kinase [Rhizoctonia solani AG-1 IB]